MFIAFRPQPNNEKALYRKSKVLQEKLRSDEAAGVLRRLTRLYPNNKGAAADLARLEAKQKKHKENESRFHYVRIINLFFFGIWGLG